MASPAPAKSQPLHYFSLPQLKWKKNHTNNHHRGRSRLADPSSPHQSPPPDSQRRQSPATHRSPNIDSASESDSGYVVPIKNEFTSSENLSPSKSEMKSTTPDGDVTGVKERKSKIYIRLPKKKADDVSEEGKGCPVEGEADESVPKTWNLRPRRPLHKQSNGNGGGANKIGVSPVPEFKSQPLVNHNRPEMEVNNVDQREKKHKFSISLSRQEIEEDIFALTGSKPSKRPKKRPRALQKQLENIFPGLWLGWITPDTYKVSESPLKI